MYSLGFSLEGREIKTALVSKQGKKLTVELVHSFPIDEEGIDPFKLLDPIVKGKSVKTVSGLTAADVILRDLHLPMTSPRKILAVLPFQAETLIPYPAEETLLHPRICKKSRKASRVFLAATKKDKLTSHLAALDALHIEPDQVSTTLHALARFASLHGKDASPYTKIAYLGRSDSFFLLMEKGEILSAKLISYPGSPLEREIKKADEFLHSKFPETLGLPWLFTGDVPHSIPSDIPTVSANGPFVEHRSFALAVGLAIDALSSDGVQWRQGVFSPLPLRKKQRKQCLFASAAFLFAATLAGPLGHSICDHYEKNLLQRAQLCLKHAVPGKKTNPQDLESACRLLHKPMIELKKEEKLGMFSPKVAELLAWLTACASEDDGSQASLTSLNYLLDQNGKVEVRLTLRATPALAESFYKKINQGDSLVDRELPVIWKKEKAPHYYAQFFLTGGEKR